MTGSSKDKTSRQLLKLLVGAMSSKIPEDWPCIQKLIDVIISELMENLSCRKFLSSIFWEMRNFPLKDRSSLYMKYDQAFLVSDISPVAYVSEDDFEEGNFN